MPDLMDRSKIGEPNNSQPGTGMVDVTKKCQFRHIKE